MTFADEVTADSPLVWWDTRQASGSAQPDRSGNNNTGTITGTPVLSSDGLTFTNTVTGDDQYITSTTIPLASGTYTTWCVEGVFKNTNFTGYQHIVGLNNPGDNGYAILATQLDNSGAGPDHMVALQYQTAGGPKFLPTGAYPDVPVNALHHIAVDSDGAAVKVYVDGAVEGTVSGGFAALDLTTSVPYMLADDSFADGFNGLIRHGMLYSHSLGATRIATHSTAALTNDPGPPGPATHFTPPTELTVPNVAFDQPLLANARGKYYPVHPRGRAVWRIPGDPTQGSSYTFNQPYPWVTPEDVANGRLFSTNPPRYPLGASDSNLDTQTIVRTFYGGSTYDVTADEVTGLTAFLTANGYTPGDWLT